MTGKAYFISQGETVPLWEWSTGSSQAANVGSGHPNDLASAALAVAGTLNRGVLAGSAVAASPP